MDGIVEYARSLATVEVALFAMELEEGIRVSLRSKGTDVNAIAACFGGGGHKVAAGITFQEGKLQQTIDIIIAKIKETGLVNGKKT
jgi:phosphoesterase RecJ-like protein